MIPLVTCFALAVVALLIVSRLFAGPTLYDRSLAAISLVIKAALISAALGVVLRTSALVDVAFALAFSSLVLAATSFKFFHARTFQAPLSGSARG